MLRRGVKDGVLAGILVLALGWTLLAPGGASASGATGQRCSTRGFRPPVIESISTRGASCAKARTLVRDWDRRVRRGQCIWKDGSNAPGVCTIGRWRCSSYHTVNGQSYPVVCQTLGPPRGRVSFIHLV